uniref:Ribosomal protein L34e n=1 Tax=Siphoviridae sp. ctOsn3 TaxID=2823577 RepID=A0A8S5LFY5_9CAUD|nr:MAG TPA: ribosomal protein L34e [Siphoviridae sp. ctOsn3]
MQKGQQVYKTKKHPTRIWGGVLIGRQKILPMRC